MKNILLLHTDAQMHHWLGAAGNDAIRTPNLDRLAAQGVRFENAFACSAVCVPSRACLMTGRYAEATGVTSNSRILHSREKTLGRFFREAGFRTGYFGKTHYGRSFGEVENEYDVFFEKKHYNQYLKEAGIPASYPEKEIPERVTRYWEVGRSAIPEEHYFEKILADRAIDFLSTPSTQPTLAFVSFVAPHGPFTPPGKFADLYPPETLSIAPRCDTELEGKPAQFVRWVQQNRKYLTEEECHRFLAAMYGLGSMVDEQVGRILDALRESGRLEETLVIFTSDHGDFGTGYGIIGKSWNMIDPLVRIPLLVRLPGGRSGEAEPAFAENIDLLPTLLEYAGVAIPSYVQGRSLLPLLKGETTLHKEESFAFNTYQDSSVKLAQSTIRRGPWRLIVCEDGPDQLYHAERDPWNWHNLANAPEHQPLLVELRDALLRHQIAVCGSPFDVDTARFWEDETGFYDETRFCGRRLVDRSRG